MKILLKSETKKWYEEIVHDGVRRIRVETSIKTHFAENTPIGLNHEPIGVPNSTTNVEYI